MISRIRGVLVERGMGVIEVMTPGGVGYQLEIPLGVYERLPREGEEVELRTYYLVREDGVTLFGFLDARERDLFGRLLTASGVGPRLALNMLGALAGAVGPGDRRQGCRVATPGSGSGREEGRAARARAWPTSWTISRPSRPDRARRRAAEEAIGALVALGYSAAQATAAVRRALDEQPGLTGTDLIKAALARVSS